MPRPAPFGDDGLCATETTRAIRHFQDERSRARPFPFRAYADRAVKETLHLLFRGKCAYCESRMDATQPMDVEHWRPKGDVEEEQITGAGAPGEGGLRRLGRGYYWLGADWKNLLPSCIDCNRRREHVIHPTGQRRITGKGNLFPLRAGSRRAEGPGEEQAEDALLLNPYHDDPARYLALGAEGVVRPRAGEAADQERAEASIRVYALNRTGLVHARQRLLHEMELRMHTIRRLAEVLADAIPGPVLDLVRDLVEHEMEALLAYADPERPYSFYAREVLARFEAELGASGPRAAG